LRDYEFYWGSQWLAFSRRSATALLNAPPAVTSWFEKCWIPDESYFHTLLGNTPGLIRRDEPLTYLREQLWASRTPFARKVDPIGRPEVVAAIDARVDTQRVSAASDPGRE
jgi:hypothetical protein